MKPAPFDYFRPESLAEALALLARLDGAKILAGGQSLLPMLNMRFVQPDHVVDVNHLELDYIIDNGDVIRIGASTRQRDTELSPLVRRRLPLVAEALQHVGHIQTRNRGTIGGSLCHLDPAAELPSVCMTLDAEIVVANVEASRVLPMRDFAAGYMTPALESGEMLIEVRIPAAGPGHGSAFEEFARRHGDFALASVAVSITVKAGTVVRAAITVGGLAPVPTRIAEAERMLVGKAVAGLPIEAAATHCGLLDAMGDTHASAEYRQHLATVLASRALHRAVRRATIEG
jgi:carbon-monoxide dehydrogenase medium subunit